MTKFGPDSSATVHYLFRNIPYCSAWYNLTLYSSARKPVCDLATGQSNEPLAPGSVIGSKGVLLLYIGRSPDRRISRRHVKNFFFHLFMIRKRLTTSFGCTNPTGSGIAILLCVCPGITRSNMTNTSFAPGWLLALVAGIAIGQSSRSMESLEALLLSFQSIINILLVPLYTLCVLLYLTRLVLTEFRGRAKISATTTQPVPSTVPLAPVAPIAPRDEDGVVNLTGSYKLVSNDNFEGFLETQGVPWALRRAANQARPIHKITHIGKSVTIQIRGIIESETTYIVDGPPVQTKIQSRMFEDRMRYLESGDGIEVTKTALTENYTVIVTRRLSEDRQSITMTSRAIFNDGRDPVQAVQTFHRVE
jgi:hypothetical protein